MRRVFWKIVYPICLILNKVFGLSYKWVNVSRAAWHSKSSNLLWHHEWFGDPITVLPKSVVLCGIGYETFYLEKDMVEFRHVGIGYSQLFFRKPKDTDLWYVHTNRNVPVCHVEQAYAWLLAVEKSNENDIVKIAATTT